MHSPHLAAGYAAAAVRLFELSPDLLCSIGSDGCFVQVNPAFTALLGRPAADLIGVSMLSLIDEVDRPRVADEFARRMAGELVGVSEARVRTADGTTRCLSLVSSARDGDGTLYCVARDVTEQRAMESRLRFQSHLLDAVGQAVIATDPTGIVTYWSKSAERMFGWSADDAMRRDILDLTPAEQSREQAAALMAALARGESWEGEMMVRRRDGSTFPALVTDTPVLDAHRRIIGIVGVSADISELQETRLRLERNQERLRHQQETLQMIIDHMPAMVTLSDASGRIMLANREWTRLSGWTEAELVTSDLLAELYPDVTIREQVFAFFEASDGTSADFPMTTRDGRELIVTWTCLRLSNGSTLGVGVDVTARRQLEQQFRQAQKLEAVGRLAGGIAHDFNNLLTVISGYTAMLLAEHATDEPMAADLGEIQAAANRAARLTRQLLAFSRQQVMNPRVIELQAVVAELESLLRRLIGEDVELSMSTSSSHLHVLADAGQVEQVVLNLIVNARDAMPAGGRLEVNVDEVELRLEEARRLTDARPGRFARIRVRDTGSGMDEHTLARIFEPFFTTKPAGKGTGLGLATVYGIVTQSGGFVQVESTVGGGSMFAVHFPIVAAPDADRSLPIAPAVDVHGGRGTILLAEDEDSLRTVVERVLRQQGYAVLSARDGAEAVALAMEHGDTIDLLLTDLVMPQMGGTLLANAIAAQLPGLPILFMTGYSLEAIESHGRLRAGSALLKKPFSPRELLSAVSALLVRGEP